MAEDYPLDAETLERGARLLKLAQARRSWITRRVERVECDDRQAIRRTTTLDLSFSPEVAGVLPRWRDRVLVPVKLLDPGKGTDATVYDGDGLALPQLTLRHERTLVAGGLASLAGGTLGERLRRAWWARHELAPETFPEPVGWGTGPRGRADDAAAAGMARGIEHYRFQDFVVVAIDLPPEASRQGTVFRLTVAQSQFVDRDASGGTPAGLRGQLRRLQVRSQVHGVLGVARRPVATVRGWFTTGLTREQLAERASDDTPFEFEIVNLSDCESFHFEMAAPPGTVVRSARLDIEVVDVEAVAAAGLSEAEGDGGLGATTERLRAAAGVRRQVVWEP